MEPYKGLQFDTATCYKSIIIYGKTFVVLQPPEGYEPSGGGLAC